MRTVHAALAACIATGAAVPAAFAQTTLETTGETLSVSHSSAPQAVVIRHPYLNSYVHRDTGLSAGLPGTDIRANPLSPALDRLRVAGPWLNLLRDDAHEDWEQASCDGNASDSFCRLRWRKSDGFTQLRSRLDDVSRAMKSRVVGKSLADHLEVDIDSSPEIKMQWQWD